MGPDEEADKSFGVSPPNSERELQGRYVDLDVVVADQNGAGLDGLMGSETRIEAV